MPTRALAAAALIAIAAPAAAQTQSPAAIEIQQLRELDAWSVSALSRADGAFAPDLWRRTDPGFLALLFDRLPAVYESPAAQALARRVLASGGDAPRGDAQAAARERFEALGKMGAAEDLAVMAAGAGGALSDPLIAQYAAQAELARGRRAEACARGRSAQGGENPPAFLLRLRAYCSAVTGDRAAAELALALARTNAAEDAWYNAAVLAAAGAPGARPPAARYDNSLNAQLSLAAQLRPGANPLNNASTLALVSLARSEQAPQPYRAQAAALAFRRRALSAADARAILRATPPETTAGLPPIASVLRQVEAAPGSLEAATAIAGLLRQANSPADFSAAARFFKDDIAALQNAPDHASAVSFARSAIVTGDAALAQRLLASARQAGIEEAALAPLDAATAVVAGLGRDSGVAVQRRIDAGGASLARAAARDVAILLALGAPADGAVQTFLLNNPPQGGTRANAGAMLALAAAVDRNAAAEGALLAVLAAGEGGPARLDADSLAAVIRALRALGLEADARAFAVEALLAGPPG